MDKAITTLPPGIFETLTDQLYDGVYFVNKDRRILFWNKEAERISGFKKRELLGRSCFDNILQHVDKRGRKLCLTRFCPLLVSMRTGKPVAERVYLRRKDGVRVPVDVHVSPIVSDRKIQGAIEVFRDASFYERVERQREQAQKISQVDALTSLPNRRYIVRRLKLELAKFRKYRDDLYVAMVDIDHFKRVNDTQGHAGGDLILRKISHILDHNFRATDYVGRFGGEEFVVILPNTPLKNLQSALERVRSLVENARLLPRGRRVTISLGAAKVRRGDSPASILKRVDNALYSAKQNGRNRIKIQ